MPRQFLYILMLLVAVHGAGCASQPMGLVASTMDAEARPAPMAPLAESLFKADQAVLSNAEIDRILTAKIVAPEHTRLRVIRVGERYPFRHGWWSPQTLQLEQQALDGLLAKLRASPRVADAQVVPTLLTPPVTTIPYLREAAARMQGDVLLVYRLFTQNFQREGWFGNDKVRAVCTAEALLLDTRTGIVMDAAVATAPFPSTRTQKDMSFEETIARAEEEATAKALLQLGDKLAEFFNSSPAPDKIAQTDH